MNIQDAIHAHNKQAVGRWWLLKYFGGLALGIFFALAALGAPLAQHHYVMPMIVYLLLSAAGWITFRRAHRRSQRLVGRGPTPRSGPR